MTIEPILADANSPVNVWLKEHPAALGGIMIAIGCLLTYFGIAGLRHGTTKGKYGQELEGGAAWVTSVIRLAMGLGACGFGLYKMIAG